MATYSWPILINWGTGSAPTTVKVIDATGAAQTPTITTAISETPASSGIYTAVATFDVAWGSAPKDLWSDGSGPYYPGDGPPPSDVRFVNGETAAPAVDPELLSTADAAGGSTGDTINYSEAYDAANEAKYVGNTLVWDGQQTTVTSYTDIGSGASALGIDPAFDSPPQPGDTISIVLKRATTSTSTGTGTGSTPIDHDGGDGVTVDGSASATNILQYLKPDTSGADALTITAYLASEYNASPPLRSPKGTTRTGPDGKWVAPLMLDSGTYKIVADRPDDGFDAQINEIVVP